MLALCETLDARKKWILQYESGRVWLSKLHSQSTQRTYLRNLRRYCKAVNKTPDELLAIKDAAERSFLNDKGDRFVAEKMLESFFLDCGMTESAKVALKTAVLSFYDHNWRQLNSNVASDVSAPESKKRKPSFSDILELEGSSTTARDKAIIWFLASTATRVGTLSLLKWNDLKATGDEEVPFQMLIESARLKGSGIGRYRGMKQVGFLHALAVEKLESYKKELSRKGYVIDKDSPIFISYNKHQKVEKLNSHSVNALLSDACLAAWHDLEKKRFSPTDFREFFKSRMEDAGLNPNMIAPLMTHKVTGVDYHYSAHEIQELFVKFKEALPYLLPQSVETLKVEQDKTRNKLLALVANVKEENEKINNAFEASLKENLKLQDSIKEAKEDANEVKAVVKRLVQIVAELKVEKDINEKIDALSKAGKPTDSYDKFLAKFETQSTQSATDDKKKMKKALSLIISEDITEKSVLRRNSQKAGS